MNDYLTEVGNSLFLIIAVLAFFHSVKWRFKRTVSEDSKEVIWAWNFVYLAVFIRIGWWYLALRLSGEDETYAVFFLDYKYIIALSTSMIFAYGVLRFIQLIEEFSNIRKALYFSVAFLVALLMGLI